MPATDLARARAQYRVQMTRWGFIWALWCAVLWGAWYLPGTAIWYERPFADFPAGRTQMILLSAGVIAALNAIATVFFLGVWTGVLGKWGELIRTARQTRYIGKWFFLAGLIGGPLAHWGTFLAIAYVGPVFAAIAALMYPIFGALLARAWYHEKITARAAAGIFLLVASGISIYAPGLFDEFAGVSQDVWLGYLGGLLAALGWGVEGAIAGRVLDVTDSDVAVSLRFLAEAIYWLVVILPALAFFLDWPVLELVREAFNPWAVAWLALAGLTYAFCYAAWYKSFPLIGVGRGCAFSTLSGLFAVAYIGVFTLEMPPLNFAIGLMVAIVGGFVMFTERSEVLEVIRAVESLAKPSIDERLPQKQ
jgi:drug/metabolite transporter (DMT)-like permease